MKRKASDEELRQVVRARLTKGSGFSLPYEEYLALQHETKTELESMQREDIFKRWPELTYDIKEDSR